MRERVCVILPLKIINTGVVPGRPAAYSAWLSTMPQKWSHSPIHPSLPSSIHLSVLLGLKRRHYGVSRRQHSDQIKPKWSLTHPHPKSCLAVTIHQPVSFSAVHYSCKLFLSGSFSRTKMVHIK